MDLSKWSGRNQLKSNYKHMYLITFISFFPVHTTVYRLQAAGLFLAVFALDVLAVRDSLGCWLSDGWRLY